MYINKPSLTPSLPLSLSLSLSLWGKSMATIVVVVVVEATISSFYCSLPLRLALGCKHAGCWMGGKTEIRVLAKMSN